MVRARHVLVSGIVQGVGFRWFAERVARELGIAGWVRNLDDGRVEIHAEGSEEALDAFGARCRAGPRSGEVSEVVEERVASRGFRGFEIRRTAREPESADQSSSGTS